MGFAPRTLQGQLTVLFLLLTLIPSLVLTVVATRQLLNALEKWENPNVQLALDGSMQLSQELMDRTENDLRQRGQLLAADPVLNLPVESIRAEAVQDRLATGFNVDFAQVYDEAGALILEVTPDALRVPPGPLPGVTQTASSEGDFLRLSAKDLIAHVGYAGAPGEGRWILVTGIYLDSGFFARKEHLTQGVAFYRRLPEVIDLRQKAALLTLGIMVLGLGAGSAWIARRLATRVSRPIQTLGTGMERVAAGDDSVHVLPHGTEETERLIQTFNAMSTELSRSRRELAQAERLSAWREVAQRVAHEMKNALTPITFSAHRIRKQAQELTEAERDRLLGSLDIVIAEVEGLNRLAASFGELARLPVPEFTRIDLGEVVTSTVSAFSQDETFEVRTPDSPVVVDGDRTLLRQALTNVIKNASEAAGPEGHVWVRLVIDDTRARMVVEDDGPGWPEGNHERSLEPYVTSKADGTGLGLSLVQRTLLQHGGLLELDDRSEGGARVTLVIPLQAASRGHVT